MSRKRKPAKAIVPIMLWDSAWKLVAIRRAIQLKHYKFIPVLALANSAGIIPIGYLLKNRGKTGEPAEADGLAGPGEVEDYATS